MTTNCGGLANRALLADLRGVLDWLGNDLWLWVLLGLGVILALFAVILFITCLCERQYLSGDLEPAGEPLPYSPSPYWTATREAAFQLGLQHAGDFATKTHTALVKGLQSLFISQDRQVIAAIASSSTAGAKLKKTVLRSRLANGRVLESTDNAGIEDFSGFVERKLLLNAGIAELMNFHLQRLAQAGSSALPFNPGAVLEEFERIDLERGARWVSLGLAYWVDPQQTSIRMNVRGAWAHVKNLFRQLSKIEEHQHRSNIPRAGSRAHR